MVKTFLEVDCFEVDMEKLGLALDIRYVMAHTSLEAAQDVLGELIKALTPESRKAWERYCEENNPCYCKEVKDVLSV